MSHSGIGAILRAADPFARTLPLIALGRLPASMHSIELGAKAHVGRGHTRSPLLPFEEQVQHPLGLASKVNQMLVEARTDAIENYRRDGTIRSESWSIEEQLEKWYKLIET